MGKARSRSLIPFICNPNQLNYLHSSSSASPFRRFCVATAEAKGWKSSASRHRSGKPLYHRLSVLGPSTGKNVSQTLNDYTGEGRIIKKFELQACIKELRKYGKNQTALEIYNWMKNKNFNFSLSDHAIFLNILSKTKGMAAAEEYFAGLLPQEKNVMTYGSLFYCYCMEGLGDKALSLFAKMDELGFASSLAFSDLMILNLKQGHPEKVSSLVDEMKRRNMRLDTFTYNIWMNSLAAMDDIVGAEKVFAEVQEDGSKCGWTVYSNLAAIYVKTKLHAKAESMLKKLEEMKPKDRRPYHYMVTLYSAIGNLDGVKRAWGLLKSGFSSTNSSYHVVLQALAKLKDVDGLKKCFEEWETQCEIFDKRLPKVTIGAYLALGLVDDAEQVLYRATQKYSPSFDILREPFILFFLKSQKQDLAFKHLEASIAESRGSKDSPNSTSLLVKKLFSYFKEEKDFDGAEEFCKMLKKLEILDVTSYQFLVDVYIAAGKQAPDLRRRIQEEQFEITSELENLLKMVSPE